MHMRYTHIRKTERLELAILRKKEFSIRDIAQAMGRNPSSVSRELKCNEVARRYDPKKADHKAYVRRKYSKYQAMKIQEHPVLEQYIREKLVDGWTPEEISGRIQEERIEGYAVSFKTIYRYLDTATGM